MHQIPVPKEDILPIDMRSLWEGMEECQTLGLTKAIGVCNFPRKMLEELIPIAKIPPAVNQVSGGFGQAVSGVTTHFFCHRSSTRTRLRDGTPS